MPWLLYRYILRDLLRVVGLTASVLVTVIAFGATIKPLANDTLLDAAQTAKYMGLAIVPMLQFALPFAAGFAATITLHRMTNDNEILAMSASGISYRRIMVPLIGLGVALTLFMVVLTQWVIPHFWVLLEQTIATDITKLFQASIDKGEPFQAPGSNLQIYADQIVVEEHPTDTGADSRMRLWHVAAAEMDHDGRIVTDVTANQAVVDVYRREGRTLLKLAMTETAAFKPASGQLWWQPVFDPKKALVMPSAAADKTKAMSRGQLLHLRTAPDEYRQVAEIKQSLADAIRSVEIGQAMDAQLRAVGYVRLNDPAEEGRAYEVHAERIEDNRFLNQGNRALEVMQVDRGQFVRRIIAHAVNLTPSGGTEIDDLTFDLEMLDCQVTDLKADTTNDRPLLKAPGLLVQGATSEDLSDQSLTDLLQRAEPLKQHVSLVRQRVIKLNKEIADLMREIRARLWNRYALSVTAMLLLALGSTLAMWLRGSLPLTIYMWAFVPSILDLILISAGEQMMRDGRLFAPFVMWSGNAIMLAAWLWAYWKLSRN